MKTNQPMAFAIAALTAWPLGIGLAYGQGAPTPAAGDRSGGTSVGLEEIIVTAQRRQESAQRAAIAISTISGDAIANANITRPGGLTGMQPSLQVVDAAGPYSIYYVRGVGSFAANAFSDATLSFNVDGVNIAKSSTSGFFYDLERVEVLKGPQGTLYGRNATGGAINVITNKPVLGEYGGNASIQYGNHSAIRVDGVLNVPLGERAAMRAAVFNTQHDGYMQDGIDDQDDIGGRLSFAFAPADTLEVTLVADYFQQEGQVGGTVTGVMSAFVPSPSFSPDDRLGFFSPEVSAFIQTQPNVLNGRTMAPFENNSRSDNRFWGLSATVDWTTPIGTFTIVPGYRDSRLDFTRWGSGVMIREEGHDKQTTLEVRLASDDDRALRYLVGAYYLRDRNDVPRFDVNQQSVFSQQSYELGTDSHAAFASLTYAFTPTLRLTGGVRWTQDDKDFAGRLGSNSRICVIGFLACPNAQVFPYSQLSPVAPSFVPGADGTITTFRTFFVEKSDSYSKVTWRTAAEWDVGDQNLIYASYETGFKAGGFFFTVDEGVYDPEELRAVTLGSKNRFLDNRLQLNLELYHWKYEDQQFSHLSNDSQGNLIFPTENVGEATIKGVELELQARLLERTLFDASVQYNDAAYDSFVYTTPNQNGGFSNGTGCPNLVPPSAVYTVNCSGERPPYAPEWSVSAGVQQTIPIGAGQLVGNARVHYQSETLTGGEFLPVQVQDAYSIWDFDLTYYARADRFFVGAYVNNAFDETALAFSFPTPLSTFMTASLRPPRTYGARAGVRF